MVWLLFLPFIFVVGCTTNSAPIDPPKEEKIANEPLPKPVKERPKRNRDGTPWIGECVIKQAQYTPDGRRIVALDTLGRIEVWDATKDTSTAKKRQPLRRLTRDEEAVDHVPMIVVNDCIVYLAKSNKWMSRDIATGKLLWEKPSVDLSSGFGLALFATNAKELVIASNKAVFLDPRTGIKRNEVNLPFQAHDGMAQISADGSILLAAERSSFSGPFREVKKVDLSTGKAVLVLRQDAGIGRVFMSHDGKRALILGESAHYWDLEKNVPVGSFRIPQHDGMTADRELRRLAVLKFDRENYNSRIVVWDVKEMKPICDFMQDQVGANMTFSPAGDEMMLAGRGYNADGSHRELSGPDRYDIYNAIVIYDWKRGVMLRTIAFPWPARPTH